MVWKPRFLLAHLLFFFCLLFLIFLLTIPIDFLCGSGLVSLLVSQAHQHHDYLKPVTNPAFRRRDILVVLAVKSSDTKTKKLRDHFEGSGKLCRCFELISCWHVTIFEFVEIVNWWVFVKCEPESSQLKEPKT